MLSKNQVIPSINAIVDNELRIFSSSVIDINPNRKIPETNEIPIDNPKEWVKVNNVVCVFVDMAGSTKLSVTVNPSVVAKAYRLFSQTIVKIFHDFDTPYIDLKGDGVFALFDSDQVHRALAAAVTCKTFADEVFIPEIEKATKGNVSIGFHGGIDQGTLLVRKIGLKKHGGRTDRQNEVWAGKTVNVACKLCSIAQNNELVVSDRYYKKLTARSARYSCGCDGNGNTTESKTLWTSSPVPDDKNFDFEICHRLENKWCKVHGAESSNSMVEADIE